MALAAELWRSGQSLAMGRYLESLWRRNGVVSDERVGYARRRSGPRFRAWALRSHGRVSEGETIYECPGGTQTWPAVVAEVHAAVGGD
jgi:hypothetical protein